MTQGVLIEVRGELSVWAALEEIPHVRRDMEAILVKLNTFIDSVPPLDELGADLGDMEADNNFEDEAAN